MRSRSTDEYMTRAFKWVMLIITGACMCGGLTFSSLKLLGFYQTVQWTPLVIFVTTCLAYLLTGIVFIRKSTVDGRLNHKVLSAGKAFIAVIIVVQYNFILYMVPSRDFWGFSFFFLILPAFFLDYKLIGAVIGGLAASVATAVLLIGERLLPVRDDLFIPEVTLRVICVVLSFTSIYMITFFLNRFMISKSDTRIETIMNKVADGLAVASQSLLQSVKNGSDATEELSNITDQLLRDGRDMLEKSKHSRENLTRLDESSHTVSALMSDMNAVSDEMAGISRDNESSMNRLVELSRQVEASTQNTVKVTDNLIAGTNKIQNALKMIDDISFNTNILALNASVEAARAGQAGKGFAVVAEEVRNLATKTQSALNDINTVMSGVQNGAADVNSFMGVSSEQLTAQNKMLYDIVESIRQLMALSGQSAESAGRAGMMNTQQDGIIRNTVSVNGEILERIEHENAMFADIAELARENKLEIAAISKQVDSLNGMIRELDELLK